MATRWTSLLSPHITSAEVVAPAQQVVSRYFPKRTVSAALTEHAGRRQQKNPMPDLQSWLGRNPRQAG